jgi:hypothetical protein
VRACVREAFPKGSYPLGIAIFVRKGDRPFPSQTTKKAIALCI